MNYRSLRPDELERLAFLGDASAKIALADVGNMVSSEEAEKDAADAEEEGATAGHKDACSDLHNRFADSILAASNGNRDNDVCEDLKHLLTYLEDNS